MPSFGFHWKNQKTTDEIHTDSLRKQYFSLHLDFFIYKNTFQYFPKLFGTNASL